MGASKAEKAAGWLQAPLFAPAITWKATPVSQMPSWTDAKRVCVDVECRDDNLYKLGPGVRRGGYVCGISFAIEDGPSHYLPIRHEGGGNLPEEAVWSYLHDQGKAFTGEVVFNSAPYDLDYFWENKVEFTAAKFHRDVQVAEPLLDELQKKYGLDAICARRGLEGKDENKLREHAKAWGIDPKTGLWRLHAGAVGAYAIGDVRAPLRLLRVQEKELEEQNLRETYDLESKVTLALVRMTRRGIRIDLDELDRVEAWAKGELNQYIDRIHQLTGLRIGSLSNAEEVGRALKKYGVDAPVKMHGGTGKQMFSIQKLWLQQQTDDVSKAVIAGREFVKLLGTYVGGYRKHLVKDRLHPTFKQLVGASDEDEDEGDDGDSSGARFGRCAAKHPNVQAQMKRSKVIQKKWRKVMVPDHGKRWFKADLGQQEPRITVHFAEICRLPGATQAGNEFRNDACFDPYQLMVELCKTPADLDLKQLRDDLKEVYLGRCYGMGGGKLAEKLKLPTVWKTRTDNGVTYKAAGPEAQSKIDRFDKAVPYVRALARMCTKSAQQKHYIIALGNRRVRFELDENGNIKDEHKALNKLIQGCLPASTRVLTRQGLRKIGDVEQGDVWIGSSWERFIRVDRGPCELAEIQLSDGKLLRCDTRHQVLVDTNEGYVFKTYADLRKGDLVCQSLAEKLDFGSERLRPVDHYWMGFCLGNAHASSDRNSLTITISDRKARYIEADKVSEAQTYYRELGFAPTAPKRSALAGKDRDKRCVTLTIESRDLRALYVSWGYPWGVTAHDKRVPDAVWTATLECRQAFLLGLLDADRTVGATTKHPDAPPYLHMCQRPLLEEVQTLLRSVGVESVLRQFPSEPGAYRLDMNAGMAAAALGYGRARTLKIHNAEVPRHVGDEFNKLKIREPWRLTASQQVIVSRLRHGRTTSVYTLREICEASRTPVPLMYVSRALVSKRALGVTETTYTLSVDHPLHRFDSEGVISKNSGAHQTKKALVDLDEAGFPLQLTVHDEFGYSGDSEEEARQMAQITCDAVVIRVPFRCDIEAGDNYGDLKKLFTVSSKHTTLSLAAAAERKEVPC